jgi:hypothetical protein
VSDPCEKPVSFETLIDYLRGEGEDHDVEPHLFECRDCASAAERLAGIQWAIAGAVPPVLSTSRFTALEREGLVEHTNRMVPGQRAEVFFPSPGKLLVHRLSGMELGSAGRVDVAFRTLDGDPLGRFERVPFDAEEGEVLVACQAHFAEIYPHDGVLAVEVVSEGKAGEVARYTVLHRKAAGL